MNSHFSRGLFDPVLSQTTTSRPALCVIDSDRSFATDYLDIAGRLDLPLRLYNEPAQFEEDQQVTSIGCLVYVARQGEFQVVNYLKEVCPYPHRRPHVIVLDHSLAAATFELVGPDTISLLKLPCDLAELERLVAYAAIRRQASEHLHDIRSDFNRRVNRLSDRQRRILRLMSAGLPNKAIANQLGVSQRTIEADRAIILRLFRADTAIEVAVRVGEYRVSEWMANNDLGQQSCWQGCDRLPCMRTGLLPS